MLLATIPVYEPEEKEEKTKGGGSTGLDDLFKDEV
jgi:hypothetical protein